METIDELKKWLNEIGNHYSALKELNQFTDYDGCIYSTYETVRKKIDELEKAKIFLQPDVSGNSALGVAVAFAHFLAKKGFRLIESGNLYYWRSEKLDKNIKDTNELYQMYEEERAKATDR